MLLGEMKHPESTLFAHQRTKEHIFFCLFLNGNGARDVLFKMKTKMKMTATRKTSLEMNECMSICT